MDPNSLLEDQSYEHMLLGTPDMVTWVLRLVALETAHYRIDEAQHSEMGLGLVLRAGNAQVGWLFALPLPGQRTLLKVLPTKGHMNSESDATATQLAQFLTGALDKFARYGFSTRSSVFKASELLGIADNQLLKAEHSADYRNVGNTCRFALIALGEELFRDEMVPNGSGVPKKDDACARLRHVMRFRVTNKRQRQALDKTITGTWDLASCLTHMKGATRTDATICALQTRALFESFAYLVQ